MTVKSVIEQAILFTNNAQLLNLNTFNTNSQVSPTTSDQAEIDLYLRCFNYVYKEIASTYFPLIEKEKITFIDNKFNFANLSKSMINIKKIFKNKKNLKYYIYPEYIFCETDTATIVYSTLPDDLQLNSNTNLFAGRVLPQVMAYGVAREYCFINGNYSDADVWETRFKQAIKSSFSVKQIYTLPKRRFI